MRAAVQFLRFFVAFLLYVTVGAEYELDEGVIVLDDDNFEAAIKEHPLILVEFYAPWCGHCKRLAPEYAAAAAKLKDDGLPLAKIDASEHKVAGEKYEVRGFPTLKLFRDGVASDYQGGRTTADLISFMRKKSGPAAKPLESIADFEAFADSDDAVVVGLFKDAASPAAATFAAAAAKDDELPYGVTSDAAALAEYAKDGDAVIVLKKFDEGRASMIATAETTAEEIATFTASYSQRLLTEFDAATSGKIFGGPIKVHMLLFADKNAETTPALTAAVTAVAQKQRGQMLHVLVPHTEGRIMTYFGLTEETLPAVMIADMRSDVKKFAHEGELTAEALLAFEKAFFAGELKPHLKTEEPAPEDDAEPVKVIKGSTFEDKVINNDKDVLLEFYAPWCGHCKSLAPKYDELAEMFAKVPSVLIAKMDATANEVDHPNVSVRGFPTLLFFKGSDKANPMTFDGSRDVEGMSDFIIKNAATAVDLGALGETFDSVHEEL